MSNLPSFETVSVEVREGTGILMLNRPAQANTFNALMATEVVAAVNALTKAKCRVLIVTGAGRHFCAGADLKAIAAGEGPRLGDTSYIGVFAEVHVPVIAAINGKAIGGGCELALACDLRIIASDTTVGLPEVRFGGIPAAGGTQRLPRIIGASRAKWLLWMGTELSADEALSLGLVDQVVQPESVLSTCLEIASVLAQRPAYALEAVKFLVNRSDAVDLATGIEMETYVARKMATSAQRRDAQENIAKIDTTYSRLFEKH
jgi:enoyl-CoA hydratase/carnithine racemase